MHPGDSRLRILFYVQHLSGVGHFVRSLTIARELAKFHDVWLTDGGKPVPGGDDPDVHLLALPRLYRASGGLLPVDAGWSLTAVWHKRRECLAQAVSEIRPDVVVVEHFPFSKWELALEIGALLDCARKHNPAVRRICSVRDIPLQTRHEQCTPDVYAKQVLQSLHSQFDALMVHADAHLCRLDTVFPRAGHIRIPMRHTGIVCQPPPAETTLVPDSPCAVASIGGGTDAGALLPRLEEHWPDIREQAGLPTCRLVMFGGLDDASPVEPTPGSSDRPVWRRPFGGDYLAWLARAELSVSCAGYNTCANLLRIGTPALLVPNTAMSDQVRRAQLLQSRGLAATLRPEAWEPWRAASALRAQLDGVAKSNQPDLRGAEGSRYFIEETAAGLTDSPVTR